MQTIGSKDGTRIAYEKSGDGPALIIIGGSLADHAFYVPLAKELSKDFAVYNFDRRGRGQSGDTLPYSVEREVEDVLAIIEMIGQSVNLYGHSAGSALALRVAAVERSIENLILADPPFTPHTDEDAHSIVEFAQETKAVQQLHDEGKHKENVVNFLSGMGLPPEVISGLIDSPSGAEMIGSAKALPYDYAMLGDGIVPVELAKQVQARTTILAAGYSLDAAQQLANAIPGATLKTLEDSTHEMAPADLADTIRKVVS
jgi:pimeloyl-ACP methyl ester carboxylesterase